MFPAQAGMSPSGTLTVYDASGVPAQAGMSPAKSFSTLARACVPLAIGDEPGLPAILGVVVPCSPRKRG